MRPLPAIATCLAALCLLTAPAGAAPPGRTQDRYFQTSDNIRLHYVEAGHGRTIVLVPGWTMPAWIWQRQIDDLSRTYHVVAFDPRGQGDSAIPAAGYEPHRRGADIGDLLGTLGPEKPVIVAWSLGVLDTLALVHDTGDSALAGLVLVDNSIGEDPPPVASPAKPGPKPPRDVMMRNFVHSMFAHKQPQPWLDRLTAAALRTPQAAANALLAYPVPRTFWKEAVYATAKPVLYIVRDKFAGQAGNLQAHHPAAETVVLHNVGHALFVDDAARFNAMLRDFIARRVWK